ncbi:MAG: hypothetical protein RL701_7891, partial [Pseudomonadota bacterium]
RPIQTSPQRCGVPHVLCLTWPDGDRRTQLRIHAGRGRFTARAPHHDQVVAAHRHPCSATCSTSTADATRCTRAPCRTPSTSTRSLATPPLGPTTRLLSTCAPGCAMELDPATRLREAHTLTQGPPCSVPSSALRAGSLRSQRWERSPLRARVRTPGAPMRQTQMATPIRASPCSYP